MKGPRHLKLTLVLVALVLALAIVAQARADVTARPAAPPADTNTTISTPSPGSSDPSSGGSAPSPGSTSDPAPQDQVPSPAASAVNQPTANDDPSTSTNQVILQVQVSGCSSHCQGTSQTQAAQQQSVAVQGPPPAAQSGGAPIGPPTGDVQPTGGAQPTGGDQPTGGASPPGGTQPQSSASTTQIQVGCVHDCSGTGSDTTTPGISQATLSQLLALLGSHVLPGQPPAPPGTQSSVEQTSVQWQQGDASGSDQSQASSQSSTTIQGLAAQAIHETAQAVIQTTQTIAQVQIGCLFYCTDTHQTQQASQANTTEVVTQGVEAATAPATAAVNVVNQLIWQLQIGCLAWCSNTTQEQTAQQSNQVRAQPSPSQGPPPADPGPPPAPGDPGVAAAAVGPPVVNPVRVNPAAPPNPPVVRPQPRPTVALPAPAGPEVTAPSAEQVAPVVPEAGNREHRPASRAPAGSSPASRRVITTASEPVARHPGAVTREHRARRPAGTISSSSWRLGSPKAPAMILFPESRPVHGEANSTDAVFITVVVLALGLLLFTTIRIRTR